MIKDCNSENASFSVGAFLFLDNDTLDDIINIEIHVLPKTKQQMREFQE